MRFPRGVMVAKTGGTIMQSRSGRSNISSTKTERKVVERNRRNQMKSLYSSLNSLLPNQNFKEAQPLPDQIDRAINYIKSLEEKLEKAREKKESLTRSRKGSYTCTFDPLSSAASKSPQLKIHEIGSVREIVLTSGLGNQFLFYEIISILHEEGVEVVSANFQALGDSFFHIVHAQMKGSADGFGAARVTERLNRFISGSTSEIELDSELWDFANHPETNWEF
ncbi:hypothetical protein POPTR_019G099400v4 [Populus trichocarpa]|uniref:BHLH domain-containing protein n=1 Tax=Populus trichocarpa TaxID=3694 RepID=A0A2K1WS70_POPTR|nr:hypothetical protein POPTR_019G099400v4 [Populus trichocarpa]|eukprot:XP_006371550.2 transcription factor bHLH162 [Populus trichocarpa]